VSPAPHVVAVLAAGGSRRLGHPKQLLRRDGETLLRRAVRLGRDTGAARVLVALGAAAARMQQELRGLDAQAVLVEDWESGLGASLGTLQRAMAADPPATVLVLGCDQPALAPAHLARLLEAAAQVPAGTAFSSYAGVRGLPAAVAWSLWSAARFEGDEGLRTLARGPGAEGFAQVRAPDLAIDLDTAADVAAAVSLGWLDGPARD